MPRGGRAVFTKGTTMNLHTSAMTKPRPADSGDVQETLNLVALYANILTQINAFLATIKSQSGS